MDRLRLISPFLTNPNPYQASFEILFPRLLKPGGVYIIEDVHWWGAVCMVTARPFVATAFHGLRLVYSASHRRPTRPGRSVSFRCHFRCLRPTQTLPARLRCVTPGSFAKVQRYLDSLYPYLWLCEKVVGPVGTPGNHCPMVLGAANQALFLARDWGYSIESITCARALRSCTASRELEHRGR